MPGNCTTPIARAHRRRLQRGDRHLVRLDHRVGEQPLAHLVDLRARGVGVGGVDDEPDHLADVHLRDVRVAERRQRPLDRRAGRIGDPGPVASPRRRAANAGMARSYQPSRRDASVTRRAPYQSARLAPVRSSYASRYSARVASITSAGMSRRGRLVVPAGAVHEVAHELLVERRRRGPDLVRVARPVPRRVGRHHLVDDDDLVVELAELELRVGEDEPALVRARRAQRRRAAARGRAAARTRRRRRARPPRSRSAARRGRTRPSWSA